MKDIYDPNLEKRIHNFLQRKTEKYPELKLFESQGVESVRPGSSISATGHPPRFTLHGA